MSYVGEIKDGVLKAYKGAPSASLKITTKATIIGTSAFKRKKRLTSVTIHGGVTAIGDSAFEECSKLKKVSFSEGLRSIGDYAFWLCGSLSDLKLPDSVEEIGDMAFYDTPWLNKQEGTVYAGTVLLRAADGKTFSFADNTSSIAGGAFRTCAELETLILPDGIKFIGNRAFGKSEWSHMAPGCTSLQELSIPDSVEKLGVHLVDGCAALRKINISEDAVNRLGDRMVENAFFLLPGQGMNAQYKEQMNDSFLVRYFTEEGIEVSGLREPLYAFARKKDTRNQMIRYFIDCDDANALGRFLSVQNKLPPEEIEEYFALAEEKNLTLCKAALLEYKNRVYEEKALEQAETKSQEKELGVRTRTAADWKRIFSYKTKSGTVEITGYLSEDQDLIIPERIGKSVVTRIGYHAFWSNHTLRSAVIPQSVTEIEALAFMNCSQLTKISIPASVKTIGTEAFAGCPNLTIHAPAGSYAEQYAKENNIPFVTE